VNLRQCQYILRIAKEGTLTAAAHSLRISQPSLSTLLASVEKEVGAKLFDRSSSPLTLTPAGEKYVAAAGRIISVYQDLQHDIDDLNRPEAGFLNIGCGPQHSPFIIPAVLPGLMKKYPKARFNLAEDYKQTLEEGLLAGSLDVIVCSELRPHPDILSQTVTDEEYVVVASRDYASTSAKPARGRRFPVIDPQELARLPFVLMKPGHNVRAQQDIVLERVGLCPRPLLETDSWQTCLRLASAGIAVSVLPHNDAAPGLHLAQPFCLPDPYYRHTVICRRRDAFVSVLMADFIAAAAAVLTGPRGSEV
jgi:DNA-binding transcriptional LysR family regulator